MEFLRSINPVWLTMGPVLVINVILSSSLIYYLLTRRGREVHPDAKKRFHSKFLSSTLKAWWYWNIDPVAKLFVKLKVTPNILTLMGFLLSCGAGFFFYKGLFGFAGWAMLIGGTFDLFDGQVARLTGRVSRSGAFFDSVMDRFSEGIVYLGLAYYFRNSWLLTFIVLGLAGSMAVSYTKARGEAVGVEVRGGSMQRPERLVYLGCSSIFQPMLTYFLVPHIVDPGPYLVIAAIVFIGVMTNFTSIYRMIFVMNRLDSQEKGEETGTVPQLLTKLATTEGRKKIIQKTRYGYDRSKSQFKTVIMLLADGARADVLKRLTDEGKLPNIAKRFVERGERDEACSVFPSATGPALTPFVTGCFPGTCNIPGIRWFDRTVPSTKKVTTKRFRDYFGIGAYAFDYDLSKNVKTIFEYSRQAYNILGMVNRGSGVSRDPAFFFAPKLFYRAKKKEDLSIVEETAFRWFTTALKKEPDFIFYYFPSIDNVSRIFGSESEQAIEAYKRLDRYVGKMEKALNEAGFGEDVFWLLTSDHGHASVERHFDLDGFLAERFKTLTVPKKFKDWEEAEAVNRVTGNCMSNIYLKRRDDWSKWHFIEDLEKGGLVASLLDRPEVDLLMGRSQNGGVRVLSRRGGARIIEDKDGRISYRVAEKDPFGFFGLPSVMNADEAMTLTCKSDYPDAILQSSQIFRSKRAGDLVVSASLGSDLNARNEMPLHRSGHGSLRKEHMCVPFYRSHRLSLQPGPYRTTDLFGLVMGLLGIEADHLIDGRFLCEGGGNSAAQAEESA